MEKPLFIYGKGSCHLPPRINLERIDDLADHPVALVFPKHQTFGTYYFVKPFIPRCPSMISTMMEDPAFKPSAYPWELAVGMCVGMFLRHTPDNMIYRWRLFVNGRAYGPVVPKDVATRRIIGTIGAVRINDEKVTENVLYWADMDEGLYGQFEQEA